MTIGNQLRSGNYATCTVMLHSVCAWVKWVKHTTVTNSKQKRS